MNIYKFYIILLLVMSLLSCSDNAEIDVRNIEKNKGPDEIINSFEMILHSGEKTEWLMKADVMKRFNAEKYWWAYIVELETMSDEEKNFYKSDSIHVSDLTDVLTGWGNVEITSPNGYLSTDKIIWNKRTDKIYAPNEIYLKKDANEITGSDLHTNMSFDFIDLENVKGQGSIEQEQK